MKSSSDVRSWSFIDLKSAEPIPSSWNSTRPSTKMQRQASGMSMNRLPPLHAHCSDLPRPNSSNRSDRNRALFVCFWGDIVKSCVYGASRSTIALYSHSSKNRRIASIEASKILSWPASHLSTVEKDTPSSREIRAFFHFDRSAKVRKRIKISAIFWRPARSSGD
jgi:hypothetical protein